MNYVGFWRLAVRLRVLVVASCVAVVHGNCSANVPCVPFCARQEYHACPFCGVPVCPPLGLDQCVHMIVRTKSRPLSSFTAKPL